MSFKLPALDRANHDATRKPAAIAGALLFLGFILLLVELEILPVPKARMTAALLSYAVTIVLTTVVYHRQGFESALYRILLLVETVVLLSGLAFAMAVDTPGLPILWSFYLLLAVLTAQDFGASRFALIAVVLPLLSLLVFQVLTANSFTMREHTYTVSGILLSGALFLFFGKNRENQVKLTALQAETERELGETRVRLEAQQHLIRIEEDWLTVLSQTASAFVLVGESLEVLSIRLAGEAAPRWRAEITAGFLAPLRQHFEAALASGEPVVQFGVPVPGNAGFVDLRIVALPAGQRDARYAVLVQDAAARVAVEEENRRLTQQVVVADKLASLGLLAAGISHELNTPLTYVKGNVDFLLHSQQNSPQNRAMLEDVDKGLREIQSIVGDLRGFSYNAPFQYRRTIDLREVLKRVERLVAAELRQRAVTRFALPADPVFVRCQPERIQQAVVNLLINASQALPARPTQQNSISLSLKESGGGAEIVVDDNGVGMSEETQGRIFDFFYTTKPSGKGTGLGLSIAFGIARDHGGTLTVASRLDEGSTFTLCLPLVVRPVEEIRVLLVDGDEHSLDAYCKALEYFEVTAASSLSVARSLITVEFHAILCNVQLPDGSGFTLYARADAELRKRIAFYSALSLDAAELRRKPEGAALFPKPANVKEFEVLVRSVAQAARDVPPC